MKKLIVSLVTLFLACPLLAVPKTVTLSVKGWTCGSCAAATKIALKKLDGVTEVKTDAERMRAVVSYDDAKVTPERMVEAIGRLGYKATVAERGVQALPGESK